MCKLINVFNFVKQLIIFEKIKYDSRYKKCFKNREFDLEKEYIADFEFSVVLHIKIG